MAGAGIKPGISHGETDEMGYRALPGQEVPLNHFHATLLKLVGIDYEKLSFPRQGLNEKLTGVKHASVIKEILS
jgi:hypothetical protein